MINIGICDDEQLFQQQCQNVINEYNGAQIKVFTYNSGDELLDALLSGLVKFDIIFMDIELPQHNGIELAAQINKNYKNIKFIFITGYNAKYSQNIFLSEINLIGYVAKPFNEVILKANITKAVEKVQKEAMDSFNIKTSSTVRQINYEDIYYIESAKHKIIVHTDFEEYGTNGRLDAIQAEAPSNFLRIHQSFIVNMNKILMFNNVFVALDNKAEVPISKAKYKQARTAYFTYKGLKL
ncbi:MAG: LytTR family DNA-binding domain-containing protein [Oscillospiraceae bacterium]